ncbi:MAG: ABC transporter ATP-binding protein [Desulfotomaculales bacterium]
MDVILAKNLTKEYNGVLAVKGINFRVKERECFGFLGPNGAGKTSTVKMIYGFSPVTSGELTVLGMDVRTRAREIKRRLGVVPQENNLDPDLKVMQNLLVYATFFGLSKEEATKRATDLLDFFGLADKAAEKVAALSGGMMRRLTIARALINRPDVLILDEPTTGLDPQARHLVWQRLRRLKEEQGVTLILTTHYMDEASQLCDRLVVMDGGEILEEGEPRQLIARHVGSEVLELGFAASREKEIIRELNGFLRGYQVVGENIFLYPKNGHELLGALQELPFRLGYQLLRSATLEDVFLKLTGKRLQE